LFERYTEKARRTIFFARYEASNTGSRGIETSHLLLGLLRENLNFLGDPLAAALFVERYRLEIVPDQAEKVPTSADLPLSHQCKRVLAYGAEEAKLMEHQHIGTEHIFLGLLREDKNIAARLSRDHGIDISAFRDQVAKTAKYSGTAAPPDDQAADRLPLHALIDTLPEASIPLALTMLQRLRTGRVPITNPEGHATRPGLSSSSSSSHFEEGTEIRQTHWVVHDQDLTVIERLKVSEDQSKLTYAHHLRGPQTNHQFELDINLT
jgi:hypothetical protein